MTESVRVASVHHASKRFAPATQPYQSSESLIVRFLATEIYISKPVALRIDIRPFEIIH
jgi:hypothetical protein